MAGAPPNNINAIAHGAYAFLATGRAPKGCGYVYRMAGQFKRAIETAVEKAHGEISLSQAALISSAVRHEARAQLIARWLRLEAASMSLIDRVATLKEIGAASELRDRILHRLKIDGAASKSVDPWADYDAGRLDGPAATETENH